jgi:hypothetical protein
LKYKNSSKVSKDTAEGVKLIPRASSPISCQEMSKDSLEIKYSKAKSGNLEYDASEDSESNDIHEVF